MLRRPSIIRAASLALAAVVALTALPLAALAAPLYPGPESRKAFPDVYATNIVFASNYWSCNDVRFDLVLSQPFPDPRRAGQLVPVRVRYADGVSPIAFRTVWLPVNGGAQRVSINNPPLPAEGFRLTTITVDTQNVVAEGWNEDNNVMTHVIPCFF